MRHKYNKLLEVNSWNQKTSLLMRWLLTSLVKYGSIVTTSKKAKVLKSYADQFFSQLVTLSTRYENEKDGVREADRHIKSVIFTKLEWVKVKTDLLPKMLEREHKMWFIANYKLGLRPGDAAEKVLVKISL